VTCLARGESGEVAAGAQLVRADRARPSAYGPVSEQRWDWVIDVSWQPRWVREALTAVGATARRWTYVSSVSVYADHAVVGADESAPLLQATDAETADLAQYGEAKVACELACRAAVGDRLLVARAGLIGGPGDGSGRSGYWVARAARDPTGPILVPAGADDPTQVVDVRDLAAWLIAAAERGRVGTFDAVGPVVPLGDWIAMSRQSAGHSGPIIEAPGQWLLTQGVAQYMGPESLPMWVQEASYAGWSARSGTAAAEAGLAHRPRRQLVDDLLAWERGQGLGRPRECGLSPQREQELLAALAAW
jgi:nucleoside-diphosphate-sugar epimerase